MNLQRTVNSVLTVCLSLGDNPTWHRDAKENGFDQVSSLALIPTELALVRRRNVDGTRFDHRDQLLNCNIVCVEIYSVPLLFKLAD